MLVANRTYERAAELAEKFDGEAIRYDDLFDRMSEADIVISSTAATHYVITKDRVAIRGQAPSRPAVPHRHRRASRHRSRVLNEVGDVYLYDIDDLNGVVSSNLEERMVEAERAEVIIAEEMDEFERWLESMEVVPTVAAIRAKAESIRAEELEKALKRLGGLSEKELKTVESADLLDRQQDASRSHCATQAGRPARRTATSYVETARYLYGLDSNPEGKNPHGLGLIKSILGRGEKSAAAKKKEMGDSIGA